MEEFSIAIQAGGASRRMGGQDKALLPFGGVTLVEYLLAQVQGRSTDLFIISNNPQFPELGVPVYSDVRPGLGALGGLLTALEQAEHSLMLLLACDMPFVHWPLLDHLLRVATQTEVDVVLPRWKEDEFGEPFRAVYRRRCRAAVAAALDAGQRRMVSFYDAVTVQRVQPDEVARHDSQGFSFLNANTPEELAAAAALRAAFEQNQK